jgi:hypothetical protein
MKAILPFAEYIEAKVYFAIGKIDHRTVMVLVDCGAGYFSRLFISSLIAIALI